MTATTRPPGIEAYDWELDPHPANKLDQWEFDSQARFAAQQLDLIGFTYIKLQPGDGTAYDISIVRPPTIKQWQQHTWRSPTEPCQFNDEDRYFVAHSLRGGLYGWGGIPMHPDYIYDKWTSGNGTTDWWTARVIGRFLTTLAYEIAQRKVDA